MDDVLLCDNLSNHDNDEVEEEDEEKSFVSYKRHNLSNLSNVIGEEGDLLLEVEEVDDNEGVADAVALFDDVVRDGVVLFVDSVLLILLLLEALLSVLPILDCKIILRRPTLRRLKTRKNMYTL